MTAESYGFRTPQDTDLIRHGDDAITFNAERASYWFERLRWPRNGLFSASDINALFGRDRQGIYPVQTQQIAADLGLPFPAPGTLEVRWLRASSGDHSHQIWNTQFSRLTRYYDGTSWSDWTNANWSRGPVYQGHNVDEYRGSAFRGMWRVEYDVSAQNIQGLPVPLQGSLTVTDSAGGVTVHEYRTAVGTFVRSTNTAGVWQPWERYAVEGNGSQTSQGAGSGSGFKTIPLALTGGIGTPDSVNSKGSVRIPIRFNAPITRWRLHLGNINPRNGAYVAGTWNIAGIYLGDKAPTGHAGHTSSMKLLASGTVPDKADLVTPWFTDPIGGDIARILSFTWEGSVSPVGLPGGCWRTDNLADAAATTPTLFSNPHNRAPFHLWIEAETYAQTPVVATVGSSTATGVGAKLPVYDSTLSRLGRARGFLPVHYTSSGDAISTSLDPAHYKWARWKHLNKPDAVLIQLGSNDVFTDGVTLPVMQQRHKSLMDVVTAQLSPVVFDTTLFPRTSYTGAQEDVRRAYNTWLKKQQDGARSVFDFVSPVSADDETLNPSMDFDGIHINDAGMQALVAAVNEPISSPPMSIA